MSTQAPTPALPERASARGSTPSTACQVLEPRIQPVQENGVLGRSDFWPRDGTRSESPTTLGNLRSGRARKAGSCVLRSKPLPPLWSPGEMSRCRPEGAGPTSQEE
uniref:Uncharacterized protein n=1 Tax=Rangifer tarandus platyrhynchus TaxID=3082113 RepID=A0ACB0F4A3_RANTA|nr:unnamed protein product [Rangifer tarandus platyrhynchus]